jgi:hypothetical protein
MTHTCDLVQEHRIHHTSMLLALSTVLGENGVAGGRNCRHRPWLNVMCSDLITSAALLDYIPAFDWDYVRIEIPSC